MLEKGLVQIYTGDGKGKTTAALGLALRAAGHGNKVLIYQFLKPASLNIGERLALKLATLSITIESLDMPWDMSKSFEDEKAVADMRIAIKEILERLERIAENKIYDVLILDEINFCVSKNIASFEEIKRIIDRKAPEVEIVMTGRGAAEELIEMADIVTDMKNIKHPFDKGMPSRKGIEF